MLKKTAVAVAVAGAFGVSAAQAGEGVETYGFIGVTMDYAKEDNGGTPSVVFLPPGSDGDLHLGDQFNSRFGFRGSNDLGNGLTAGYRFEFGVGTSAFSRGSVREDAAPIDKRLAWVSLGGDWGTLKLGNQWGTLYEYVGSTIYVMHGFGGAPWYEATQYLSYDAYGLRVSDAVEYTWGAGGYGSDPFTFTVQGIFDQVGDQSDGDDTLDAVTIAGQAVFGNFTVGGAYYTESNTASPEPEMIGVYGRAQVTDALYVGATFMTVDRDDGGEDVDVIAANANMDFGNGIWGSIGGGFSDNGTDGDLTTINAAIQKDMGSGLLLIGEFEWASRDAVAPGGDPESTVVSVGFKYNF